VIKPSSLPLAFLFVTALTAPALVACGQAPPPPAKAAAPAAHADTQASRAATLKKWMAREVAPAPHQKVDLFEGYASGEIESLGPVHPECKQGDNGSTICTIVADLGKDQDDPEQTSSIACVATTAVGAVGPTLKADLGNAQLDEVPTLGVETVGQGLAMRFVANTTEPDGDNVLVGTEKLAALYAHGYMVTCFDKRAGGRKTFDRVTRHFFESLSFTSTVTVFASGHRVRAGDRTAGLRYASIAQRSGDPSGFVEQYDDFWLDTDGKTWSIKDSVTVVQRDAKGAIEKLEDLYWLEGQGPAVLSARPSEDRKFRLKYEVGEKSNGLESTPKAPLNTELWAAPEFLKVSAGSAAKYRYSFLDLIDSDPAFHYVTITRAAPGVVSQAQEALAPGQAKDAAAAAEGKVEAQIDPRGLVTRAVSSRAVWELVYTWGKLPGVLSATKKTKR
jgi:hypothetical protein